MQALKVEKKKANDLRKILMERSLINLNFKIKSEGNFVFFPVTENFDEKTIHSLSSKGFGDLSFNDLELLETDFEPLKRSPRSMKDILKDILDEDAIEELKNSFDIIGDVVILEIPPELQEHKHEIGEAALKFTKRKSVYMKTSAIKGVVRTRELEHLAGDDVSETIHIEYGSRLALDVKNVYFSPRLATERHRVAQQVQDGELILDMFAGVGPFAMLIARAHDVTFYAVDINPHAYEYLKKNIALNKVENKVMPILGDISEVLEKEKIKADRIIMNLPGTAWQFLDLAMDSLKEGGIIHYYEFASDFDQAIERLEKAAHPRKIEIMDKRKVKSSSPGQWHVVVDAKVN